MLASANAIQTVCNQDFEGKWLYEKLVIAFTFLKAQIATMPSLKHFDQNRPPVIVIYASKWAVSSSLLQEKKIDYCSVTFSSRSLKPNEG